MSGLEVPGFLIGVAGLFSSCVDAFAYFKLAQRAGREIEVVLLKLDIEKTRLLVWAENVGIFSAADDSRNPKLLDEHVADLIQQILSQIKDLLTDSDKLRVSYGVRTLDGPRHAAVDYVSSKSFATFRTAASRFWTRNVSKLTSATTALQEGQSSKMQKIRWAIYEREKFQALVNDLSQFVDSLFELANVGREVQDRVIIEDIESNLDVAQLSVIEEATEDSYRAYSQAAASVRESTVAGTVDRRNLVDYLKDIEEWDEGPGQTNSATTPAADQFWTEVKESICCAVLTSGCPKLRTDDPCDPRLIGTQAEMTLDNKGDYYKWNVAARNNRGGTALWQLINNLIDVRSRVITLESETIGELLKDREGKLSTWQTAFIRHRMPLLRVYIYCAPCACLIHTASAICGNVFTTMQTIHIRPDDRLVSSCCANVDRSESLRNLLEHARDWEAAAGFTDSMSISVGLDTVWMDRRLEHLDYEEPYNYVEDKNSRVIVLGEADYLSPLVQRVPGRIPRATDIWRFSHESATPKRTFFSRFVEMKFPNSSNSSTSRPTPSPNRATQSSASAIAGLSLRDRNDTSPGSFLTVSRFRDRDRDRDSVAGSSAGEGE